MRLKILLVLLGLTMLVYAGDLTDVITTPSNRQNYNQTYRAVGDGTNAQTGDNVTANITSHIGGSGSATNATLVKGSGGYLDNVTFETLCAGTSSYVFADASATNSNNTYAVVLTTVPQVSGAIPINIPFHIRFVNGLVASVTPSTCTAVVSYR